MNYPLIGLLLVLPSMNTLIVVDDPPSPIAVTVPTREKPVSYSREIAEILDAK